MPCKKCKSSPVFKTLSGEGLCSSNFVKYFEKKVLKTIGQYKLIEGKDVIAVALSGGKDSSTLLYILNKLLKKRRQKFFALLINEGIHGYRNITIKDAKKLCKQLKVPLKIVSYKEEFGTTLDELKKKYKPCTACGILRRYSLNKIARDLGATKLATGHNLDDEAQTLLMNMLKGNFEFSAKLGPKTEILMHDKFIPRIKPLYFLTEKEVLIYSKIKKLPVTFIECPNSHDAFRDDVRSQLNELEAKYPGTKHSIVNGFLDIQETLQKRFQREKINSCKICGEPSVKQVCRACQILKR
ncbi:MAG TPA: TIGR00269 family protein [Candidatus Nanoarchaeia archaeon]|nr:TIGR00269 family protein [Candidatus Nanoarchaeia archaeon]